MAVMCRRRARPTLRLLREDLGADLGDAQLGRALEEGRTSDLLPLSSIPHPIIQKAASAFAEDPLRDHHDGRVRCVESMPLLEIRAGQWRGGVWVADDGVCWLVACGLAKGDHEDRDDFYEALSRREARSATGALMPTEADLVLWKKEVVSEALAHWELEVQAEVATSLDSISAGGSVQLTFCHPLAAQLPESARVIATVTIEVNQVRDDDYLYDDVVVTVDEAARWAGSSLAWQLIIRVLISISPPEQDWDTFKKTYSNMLEPDELTSRQKQLKELGERGELAESRPGQHAHHAHRRSLADRVINGHAARALCGVFFVPRQDHERLPTCPTCDERLREVDSQASQAL